MVVPRLAAPCAWLCILILLAQASTAGSPERADASAGGTHETRKVRGWVLHIQRKLLDSEPRLTELAVALLDRQLAEVIRVVPEPALVELRKVPLYFSLEYPGKQPTAEFHPSAGWLRVQGRDPAMAKCVEFTNIRIFEREMSRMPNFALHELAHAYHFRVLPLGFDNPRIKKAFDNARSGGKYDRVQRRHGEGRPTTFERAYALRNAMEYFAETTEAFFSRNDFFPFNRADLQTHDPEMFALLTVLWGVEGQPTP